MNWKNLSVEETIKRLKTNINGLTGQQAEENRIKYGKNE